MRDCLCALVLCEKWQSGEEAAASSLLVPTGPQFHTVRQQNRHHSADRTAPQVHGMILHPSLHFFLHQKRHDHHITCTSLKYDCGFSNKEETSRTHCCTVEKIKASARVSGTVLHRQWFTLNTEPCFINALKSKQGGVSGGERGGGGRAEQGGSHRDRLITVALEMSAVQLWWVSYLLLSLTLLDAAGLSV